MDYYYTMKAKLGLVLIVILMFAGVGWRIIINNKNTGKQAITNENKDKYTALVDEVYDKIQQNYWEKISDADLSNLFLLADQKLTNGKEQLKSRNKAGVNTLLAEAIKPMSDDKRKDFTASLVDIVMANLQPFGRSRLYSEKDATSLSNTVNNVNPGANYFEQLGVSTSASDTEIKKAFEQKSTTATTSAEKEQVKQAYSVLKNSDSRKVYETSGVEPTIDYKLISPEIFYMHLTKFSPTSLDEFARVAAKVDGKGEELNTLILDLRDNIGGSIDILPYFLGPFIGPDNYAYQFYQQGNKQDFKTVTGWLNSLVRYKKVVILINGGSQSTAEVMAATLKKYNVGVLVGTHTKGWGTVEKVFPLDNQIANDEKFSLFLVHHITLRDDGQPIEGRGVDPTIDITSKDWQKELLQRFGDQKIVSAVGEIWKGK
jgi:C-terminal processing protease CtpA/Prc